MAGDSTEKRDWRVSAVLLAVWVVAVIFVAGRRDDIPLSMIAIASVFFVMLIPSMNDLVRSLEKRIGGTGDEERG
jgi:hypothetical protein